MVIALTGGELVYFEMDPSGQLNEYTESKEMSKDVVCMALGRVPSGEQRCRFLAIGLADNTVRIFSLDPSVSRPTYCVFGLQYLICWPARRGGAFLYSCYLHLINYSKL